MGSKESGQARIQEHGVAIGGFEDQVCIGNPESKTTDSKHQSDHQDGNEIRLCFVVLWKFKIDANLFFLRAISFTPAHIFCSSLINQTKPE